QAGTDLVTQAGTDLVTQAGTDLVTLSDRSSAIVRTRSNLLSGTDLSADNRPSMLEKDMYDSWKSRMELYMLNRPHDRIILESVEQGPLIWPSMEVE
nr:hypothetical protein [Tanacetum cinerariifolium]